MKIQLSYGEMGADETRKHPKYHLLYRLQNFSQFAKNCIKLVCSNAQVKSDLQSTSLQQIL